MTSRILCGDARAMLATLPENSVHFVVTSPPYLGLRAYGTVPVDWPAVTYSPMPGLPPMVEVHAMTCELGQESAPEAYIGHLVLVFRDVWRVMADDAVCFVNIGDSYSARPGQRKITDKAGIKQKTSIGSITAPSRSIDGLPAKNLIGIPWRLAFALQADGWWLRQGLIWAKENAMPESIKDRCCKSHEDVFLLTKKANYYFDHIAIQERAAGSGNKAVQPLQKDVTEGLLLQEQSTERWQDGALRRVYSGDAEGIRPEIPCDHESKREGQPLRVIPEGAGNENDIPQGIHEASWSVRDGAGARAASREVVNLQSEAEEIQPIAQRQGMQSTLGRAIHKDTVRTSSEKARGNKAQISTDNGAMYLDTEGVGTDQGGPSIFVRILQTEKAVGKGSCNSVEQGRQSHEGEHRSCVSEVQREQGEQGGYRTKRSVWTINTESFRDLHYATFPVELPTTCIKAGTSERGHCPECNKRWVRVVDRTPMVINKTVRNIERGTRIGTSGTMVSPASAITTGWQAQCACGSSPVPDVVLDPFSGAGTSGLAAERLQRDYIGIELSEVYASMSRVRIVGDAPLFTELVA